MKHTVLPALFLSCAACVGVAQAADWSDTSLSWRRGTQFAEPFGKDNITKNIYNLSQVSGYKYGTNFFSIDYLMSDSKDPAAPGSQDGAREIYAVYRHTLDLGKVTGKDFSAKGIRGLGATAGFDVNTKDDAGYNSKKQMAVVGPTLFLDVPGFLNVSLLQLFESNAPCSQFTNSCVSRYEYKPHPMLAAAWGIPFSLGVPLSFEGYANWIAPKGKDEYGNQTATETNIDMQVMYDASASVGASKNTFKVGAEYQFWKNKFGNDHNGAAGAGAYARTPMIRAEYHF